MNTQKEKTFFGQPFGLANLFGIEMWERFSFYGMQGILLFYMYYSVSEGGLGMDKTTAASIVGAYGGLVYMAAIVASFVADRLIGAERTLFYSAILVMFGHIALAAVPGIPGLALGLVAVAVGSAGVKTTAMVVLGQLYDREDPRRDAGFSIFYLGINLGGLIGPLLTGWLWGMKGFHYGFGLAAVGMALGLIQYTLMRKTTLKDAGRHVPNPLPRAAYLPWGAGGALTVAVVTVLITVGVIPIAQLATIVSVIALVAAVSIWAKMFFSQKTTAEEKSRLLAFVPLCVSGVVFFGIFQQQFTVIAIYSDVRLDRSLFGLEISPAWIQSINPLLIVIFAGLFAVMWTKLGSRQWTTTVKFAVANILIGLSLFCFIPFAGGQANSTPLIAIVWILFLFTIGELLLSPVGNSVTTKIAPAAFQSQTMAVWLMVVSMGTSLAGSLAGFYHPEDAAAETQFFLYLGVASIVVGVILIFLKKWIGKKLIDVR